MDIFFVSSVCPAVRPLVRVVRTRKQSGDHHPLPDSLPVSYHVRAGAVNHAPQSPPRERPNPSVRAPSSSVILECRPHELCPATASSSSVVCESAVLESTVLERQRLRRCSLLAHRHQGRPPSCGGGADADSTAHQGRVAMDVPGGKPK
ncbi:hypothetical protein BDA96_10G092800 [Sorghum bicolor]|uniref:Uncharacterized protein n=1 Tax=Sorghum bicolor TaxID=4558 RepID=A0A921Q0D7_SORBI|nr:hypothetical protein BDA96_10G092800 [Sorghum bicolor]